MVVLSDLYLFYVNPSCYFGSCLWYHVAFHFLKQRFRSRLASLASQWERMNNIQCHMGDSSHKSQEHQSKREGRQKSRSQEQRPHHCLGGHILRVTLSESASNPTS